MLQRSKAEQRFYFKRVCEVYKRTSDRQEKDPKARG
jgi:hypothetical protein